MAQSQDISPADVTAISAHDVDEAGEVGARLYYPQRLTSLERASSLSMSVRAGRIGPFVLGELSYDADVRIDCGDLETSYHVNLPLSGRVRTSHRGVDSVATPTVAAVYGPEGRTVLSRWEAGARQLCVKIDRDAVESALAERTGHRVTHQVTFAPTIDLRDGAARSWAELATMLSRALHTPGSLAHQPLVAAPLVDGLVNGLLCAVPHDHRDEMLCGRPSTSSSVVREAVDWIHEHAAEPITTSQIAARCAISVRALQEGFARDLGRSPMQYLRDVRLRRAHAELLAAAPRSTTVSVVANRWGFTNPGRFATAHEATFGEPPAATLRRGG